MIIVFSSNDVLESGAHFDFGGCINLHSRLSLITIMATRSKRMRKEKSGFEKRREKKQQEWRESCNAPGQTSLSSFIVKQSTCRPSSTGSKVSTEAVHTLGLVGLNHENEISTNSDAEWYKGKKLDLEWLLQSHQCLSISREKYINRKRTFVTCLICAAHEDDVKKYSNNGKVPLARGVRTDGKDRLMNVIDHLESEIHQEATRLEELKQSWANMSDSHPWVRILSKTNSETRKFLVCLAIDVVNDSLVETLSARSWPSRSMSMEYANNMLDKFETNGWDTADISFNPPASMFHYRSPIIYAEMLEVIADLQKKQVGKTLSKSLCFSVKIDGSMDRQQQDSKFVTARYIPQNEVCVQTVFVGVISSDEGGAKGLLDAYPWICDDGEKYSYYCWSYLIMSDHSKEGYINNI